MEIIQKYNKLISLGVLLLAVFLITFDFTNTPKVWGDEGVFTNVAESIATNGHIGLQIEPGVSSPLGLLLSTGYPVVFPIAVNFYFFDIGLIQARSIMLIYMLALIVLSFFLTKKLYGFNTAIITVMLLLSFAPFYGNGRPVQGEVPGLVFFIAGLLAIVYWERGGFVNYKHAFISGLMFGLSSSVKPLYLLVILVSSFFSYLLWYKKIQKKKVLLYFFIGFVAPLLVWVCTVTNNIDFSSGFFSAFFSFVSFFVSNHGSSLNVFDTVLKNASKFFTESTPVLFLFLLITVVVVFLLRFYKKISKDLSLSEVLIIFFIFINLIGYLKGTGWYRYFFPANMLIYLLFPAALINLSTFLNKRYLEKISVFILSSLICFQFYYLIFRSSTSFVAERTRNKELSLILSKIEPNKKILFYNTGEAIVFLPNSNYYQYTSMEDFLEVGNKESINDNSFDYILTDKSQKSNVELSCYVEKSIDRYYFLEKKFNCKTQ